MAPCPDSRGRLKELPDPRNGEAMLPPTEIPETIPISGCG